MIQFILAQNCYLTFGSHFHLLLLQASWGKKDAFRALAVLFLCSRSFRKVEEKKIRVNTVNFWEISVPEAGAGVLSHITAAILTYNSPVHTGVTNDTN